MGKCEGCEIWNENHFTLACYYNKEYVMVENRTNLFLLGAISLVSLFSTLSFSSASTKLILNMVQKL